MTAALEGGDWSAARPGCILPPGKTGYPFYRRLGGPQGRSGRAENLVPTGIRSRTVQPVVSRYTDWATRPTATLLPPPNNLCFLSASLSNYQWACIIALGNNFLFSRSLKLLCFVLYAWKYEDCDWRLWSVVWISAFPDLKFANRKDERSIKECDKAVSFATHTLRTQINLN